MSDKKPKQKSLFPSWEDNDFSDLPKKLSLDEEFTAKNTESHTISSIPDIFLPTRWERLEPRISNSDVSYRIIRPVQDAINNVVDIVEYLRVTDGGQVLIIRGDTGCGKTTFLNTIQHYVEDVNFDVQTIDLSSIKEDEFGDRLRDIKLTDNSINLIILEGREKPEDISESYIQIALSNINRFTRSNHVPLLVVVPTIDEQVARRWCQHGESIGDLIPRGKLYDGSRWYTFPGVPKDKYIEIAEETVKALNSPNSLENYGLLEEELINWVDVSPTIGSFMEKIATEIANRRKSTKVTFEGRREHVWVVYCAPDLTHFDHTYLIVQGLTQNEKLEASPKKLIPASSDNSVSREWRQSSNWKKILAAISYLDVRIINFPIITTVSAALAYGSNELLESFKSSSLNDYREQIESAYFDLSDIKWEMPLAERRLQKQNAINSIERTNLFLLLKGMSAGGQRGFQPESAKTYAQYLHLREQINENELHMYIGQALQDILTKHQMSAGVETENPLVPGKSAPRPDITVHTNTDIFALEFHFFQKQFTNSEISRYAVDRVITKYMRELPTLSSQLDRIE